tara:strand:+ start:696 stop:1193 length:498 start_codon:yes stop_codon:yes gene_type:complete
MNKDHNYPLHIALFEPRIPQNTGNIARTCAAFKVHLHLIKPLGFEINDKYLKRAGLDYWQFVKVSIHNNFNNLLTSYKFNNIHGFSKSGNISINKMRFRQNELILLGREDSGLPNDIINCCDTLIKIPMPGGTNNSSLHGVRSLNLSVAAGISIFKALDDIGQIN